MIATWSVTYETSTLQQGIAPTKEEAERIAVNVHDSYVVKGLNPDALAWHVESNYCPRCNRHHEREGAADEKCQRETQFARADHRRRGGVE
jgi:hypothetical protein